MQEQPRKATHTHVHRKHAHRQTRTYTAHTHAESTLTRPRQLQLQANVSSARPEKIRQRHQEKSLLSGARLGYHICTYMGMRTEGRRTGTVTARVSELVQSEGRFKLQNGCRLAGFVDLGPFVLEIVCHFLSGTNGAGTKYAELSRTR